MWRIAALKSITQRGVTRKEMMSYRVGDRIDINPYHTDALTGWKLGQIIDLSLGQACVSLSSSSSRYYWVHLDNQMEASPPHKHTQKAKKRRKKKRNKDLSKQETQQIIESFTAHKTHLEDTECNVYDGYRLPFREFEENPNKKLKLLPQDSSASETAGFVMVNYPQNAAAIEFGSAQTDKEVQHVLKALNIDHNKRHTTSRITTYHNRHHISYGDNCHTHHTVYGPRIDASTQLT
eukprot:913100_1